MGDKLILKLDRGSDGVLNLNNQNNYGVLKGFQPRVAKRQKGQLGGHGPYLDVDFTIPLRVFSKFSADAALSALEDLVEAIEQAGRWQRRAKIDPVLLTYLPPSSTLTTPLLTPLLGSADSARGLLDLPVAFNELTNAFEINPVNLSVTRRGLWLGEEETSTTSVATANPGKMTVTFTNSVNLPSPIKVVLDATGNATDASGLIFIANDDAKIIFIESSSLTASGANWSTQVEASASGGDYLRLTPNTTALHTAGAGVGSVNTSARRFSTYAAVRNKSTTLHYTLQANYLATSSDTYACRPVTLDNSDQTTQMLHLGVFSLPLPGGELSQISLFVTPSGTGTSSDAFELDYLVIIAMDEYTRVIAFSVDTLEDLIVDPSSLAYPDPFVTTGSSSRSLRADGDSFLVHAGNELCVLVCGQSGTGWTLRTGGGTNIPHALTAYRRRGYLVPQ